MVGFFQSLPLFFCDGPWTADLAALDKVVFLDANPEDVRTGERSTCQRLVVSSPEEPEGAVEPSSKRLCPFIETIALACPQICVEHHPGSLTRMPNPAGMEDRRSLPGLFLRKSLIPAVNQ